MNHEEIIKRLREPFSSKDVEWKIQVVTQDKARGMAVVYLDARAVQKRLDDVVGPFNWKNIYSLWHDKAQICGISIFNDERNEWVTKWDGAENSDIEPIKGGLSDSFKRTACVWGIGRYMYDMDGIWVEVEAKGKSFAIKQNQYSKLESEYNAAVGKLFGKASNQQSAPNQQRTSADSAPAGSSNRQTQTAPTSTSASTSAPKSNGNTQYNTQRNAQQSDNSAYDFKVQSIKPSGKSSQMLELVGGDGKVTTAYIKTGDQSIVSGSRLRGVKIERKTSSYGEYNLINEYQLAA